MHGRMGRMQLIQILKDFESIVIRKCVIHLYFTGSKMLVAPQKNYYQ